MNQLRQVELPEDNFYESGAVVTDVTPTVTYDYDLVGNRTHEIRDLGGSRTHTVATTYDGLKRPIEVSTTYTDYIEDPDGVTKTAKTWTFYDENGNKVKAVDAKNTPKPETERKAFIYTYTARNWLKTETDPEGHTVSYIYDAAGNRKSLTDQRGNASPEEYDYTIWYVYDDQYRLIRGILPDSTPPADPFTDSGSGDNPVVRFAYDRRGTLKNKHIQPNAATNGQLTEYTYYPRYRVHEEKVSGGGTTLTTTYTYENRPSNATSHRRWESSLGRSNQPPVASLGDLGATSRLMCRQAGQRAESREAEGIEPRNVG